jgi:hypothetical protein
MTAYACTGTHSLMTRSTLGEVQHAHAVQVLFLPYTLAMRVLYAQCCRCRGVISEPILSSSPRPTSLNPTAAMHAWLKSAIASYSFLTAGVASFGRLDAMSLASELGLSKLLAIIAVSQDGIVCTFGELGGVLVLGGV